MSDTRFATLVILAAFAFAVTVGMFLPPLVAPVVP
jgi:hypothetical protein